MKSDIKINYSKLEEIEIKTKEYKIALEDISDVLKKVDIVLAGNTGESIDSLKEYLGRITDSVDSCYTEVTDIDNILLEYLKDMQSLMPAINNWDEIRVHREDIYFNMRDIKKSCDLVLFKCMEVDSRALVSEGLFNDILSSGTDDSTGRMNQQKLESIVELGNSYRDKFESYKSSLDSIFNFEVVRFEEQDDVFGKKAKLLYDKLSTPEEKGMVRRATLSREIQGGFEALGDIAYGLWQGVCKLPKGIPKVISSYAGYSVGKSLDKVVGWYPSILQDEIDNAERYNGIIGNVFSNPYRIIEGLAQNVSDNYEEKGIGYTIGDSSLDIIDLFIGTKGILKAVKGRKLINAVDDVSDAFRVANTTSKLEKSLDGMRRSAKEFLENTKGFIIDDGTRIYFSPSLEGLADNYYYIDKIDLKNAEDLIEQATKDGRYLASTKGTKGVPFVPVVDRITEHNKSKYITQITVERQASWQDSDFLRENLKAQGVSTPPYKFAAHHIVAVRDPRAKQARDILIMYNIDLNSACNGVFLPNDKYSLVTTEAKHSGKHIPEYFSEVNRRISIVEERGLERNLSEEAIRKAICDELQNIRADNLNGTLSPNTW